MSNRRLRLMRETEIVAIFDGRTGEIRSAEAEQAVLQERKTFAITAEERLGYQPLAEVMNNPGLTPQGI